MNAIPVSPVVQLATIAFGVVLMLGLTLAGLQYITSGGDREKLEEARFAISRYMLVLLLVITLWIAGNFLINFLAENLKSSETLTNIVTIAISITGLILGITALINRNEAKAEEDKADLIAKIQEFQKIIPSDQPDTTAKGNGDRNGK